MCDGETNQIAHVLQQESGLLGLTENDFIDVLKLAASCSKSQQAGDVMKGFAILHAFLVRPSFVT